MNNERKIIFMGTPEFAVPAMKALYDRGYHIVQVVTQPDRRSGRGRKLLSPAVKAAALHIGLPVIQPETVMSDEFRESMKVLSPDYFVVVAFGHLLKLDLLTVPTIGSVNIHASILPGYRGPAPIQWAIINGESRTGVTTMFMDPGMDTGDILLMERTDIDQQDSAQTLHDRLSLMGADLIVKTLEGIENGSLKPLPQDHAKATYAPMLVKENGRIVWEKTAAELDCFIRGMTPWPGAFTFHNNRRLKIYRAKCIKEQMADQKPGTVVESFPGELYIASGKGILSVEEIQGASGKRLHIRDFLAGYKLLPGEVLS